MPFEEYRDDAGARRRLDTGLKRLRDEAREGLDDIGGLEIRKM